MPTMGDQMKGRPPEPVFPQPPMQRTVNGPLSFKGLGEARRAEALRMEWDSWYINAAQARSIPIEAMTDEIVSRIRYSQRDWPENRMTLGAAMGPVEPGEGETYWLHGVDQSELFWAPEPDAPPVEHMMPGRRGIDRGER